MPRLAPAAALAAVLLALVALLGGRAIEGGGGSARTQNMPYRVVVPLAVRAASPGVFAYAVEPGDTLASIAARFATTEMTLVALNGANVLSGLAPGILITVGPPPPAMLPCNDPLVPVNKGHALAAACEPVELVAVAARFSFGGAQRLTPDAAAALDALLGAGLAAGHELVTRSTYRSYETQEDTFAYWVSVLGLEEADRTSARAGHSEHQLGTAADVISAATGYELLEEFGATPEGIWLARNAPAHGFAISYPEGSEPITGYGYEPWHLRYVGLAAAAQITSSGLTPHEFLMRLWVTGTGPR